MCHREGWQRDYVETAVACARTLSRWGIVDVLLEKPSELLGQQRLRVEVREAYVRADGTRVERLVRGHRNDGELNPQLLYRSGCVETCGENRDLPLLSCPPDWPNSRWP